MLTKRVCFVLGAGASVPYGFPTGGGLLELAIRGPPDEWWPLVQDALNKDKAFHGRYVETLLASGAPSLDHFAGKVAEYKEYTKALIAYFIGRSEVRANIINANGERDWSRFFINLLVESLEFQDFPRQQVDVVTFNFDRSFEEAVLIRLSTLYQKSRKAIAAAISHWNIVHVHGSLGQLPEFTKDGDGRTYEHSVNPALLKLAIANIKLLDDAQKESKEFQIAQKLIQQAEVLFVLGFGFHRLNCERVFPQDWKDISGPQMFATIEGLTDGRIEKAGRFFMTGPGLEKRRSHCLALLRQLEHVFSD